MNILRNFDARKIAKAKTKIFLAVVSVVFIATLIIFPGFRAFSFKHPGLIGVLVGVSGEVYFDWKEEKGKNASWKRFFMALLVVSLTYELIEASENDKEAADAIKLAGQANERANALEAQVMDTSNIVVQANERIALAQKEAANAEKESAESNERAAKFDADRALVEKEAEQIRSKNLELESEISQLKSQMQPRTLTTEQQNTLTNILIQCPKGQVFVLAPVSDSEATEYAKKIEKVLRVSGFDVIRPTMPDPKALISTSVAGLGLVVKDDFNAPWRAYGILGAFKIAGIPMAFEVAGEPDFPTNEVDIRIGTRF